MLPYMSAKCLDESKVKTIKKRYTQRQVALPVYFNLVSPYPTGNFNNIFI